MTDHVVRPSYRLQRDENSAPDVVHSFREIYDGFAREPFHNDALLSCFNKCWTACEQPLFLLGYFLHPSFKSDVSRLIHSRSMTWSRIFDFAIYYHLRFIGEDCGYLRGEIYEWLVGNLTSGKTKQHKYSVLAFGMT